jgi:hypothetical protein
MDSPESVNQTPIPTPYETIDPCELLEKAKKLGAFSVSAANNGNVIVLYTMMLLQRVLTNQLFVTPLNIGDINALAYTISYLNSSLKIQQGQT